MDIKELMAQRDRLNNEIRKIETEKATEQNAALVGKCFKFSNSYGDMKRWWLYARITAVRGSNVTVDRFQEMSDGIIEIRYDEHEHAESFRTKWQEIDQEELASRWDDLVKKIIAIGERFKPPAEGENAATPPGSKRIV